MSIAAQLEEHAHQELQHALTISRQIDYLGLGRIDLGIFQRNQT